MSTKSKWKNSLLHFIESTTQENVFPLAPVVFIDDFLGKALDVTNAWGLRDTGAATETLVADAPNGAIELLLTNAIEAQLAGVDFADQRSFILNQALIAEFRARFTTLPANASTAVLGLCGDHNADIDTVAESAWFRWNFSGAVLVETDDTVNETSNVATGITALVNEWRIYRIDFSNPADVRFYIDGASVATGTTFNMSNVPGLKLQPVARLDKGNLAANLGVMEVDYVKVWQKRS